MIDYAGGRKGTAMMDALAAEILDAVQQYGRGREETRRHAQDGASQPRVCPLPLVVWSAILHGYDETVFFQF